MDGTRRLPTSVLCGLVWGPEMGFHSESFRFEGGGRHIIIGRVSAMTDLRKELVFLTTHKLFLYFVGLNRTGKSCRLRWVNYLHPGLKRGKMSPQEERLVLELHAKWGNRWSRIARKLPGRTDNEIKNYWRTHMRKKAQEKKRANNSNSSSSTSPSPSRSSSSNSMKSSSSSSNITTVESLPFPDSTTGVESFYDTGGRVVSAAKDDQKKADDNGQEKARDDQEKAYYSMDDIWKDIALPEVLNDINTGPFYGTELGGVNDISEGNNNDDYSCPADPLTMVWDDHHYYCSDSLWKMDEESNKAPFFFGYEGEGESLTG